MTAVGSNLGPRGDDTVLTPGSGLSSFTDHLRNHAPHLLPENRFAVDPATLGSQRSREGRSVDGDIAPHGTTIVSLTFNGGVIIAGDRRATMGNVIASRDVEKVHITDEYSAAGIAGTAGLALELVRLFAIELEHYEKIEGMPLSFNGKANKLSSMVRGNLGAAMQGLAVVPLLVGYDLDSPDAATAGRIVSYDVVGGRYEERAGYHAVGSGSVFAKSAMKKLYRSGSTEDEAVRVAVEALYDAADDDSATGGPDVARGIYPTAVVVGAAGAQFVDSARLETVARAVVSERTAEGGRAR